MLLSFLEVSLLRMVLAGIRIDGDESVVELVKHLQSGLLLALLYKEGQLRDSRMVSSVAI